MNTLIVYELCMTWKAIKKTEFDSLVFNSQGEGYTRFEILKIIKIQGFLNFYLINYPKKLE